MNPELESLRKRVKNQRRELRLLSKAYFGFLRGFQSGVRSASVDCFRGKMTKAFGHEAVWRAERGIAGPAIPVPQGVVDTIQKGLAPTDLFVPAPNAPIMVARDPHEVSMKSYSGVLYLVLHADSNGERSIFAAGPAKFVDGVNAVQDASGRQFVRIPEPHSWVTALASSTHAPTPAGAGLGTPHSPGSSPSTSPHPESEPDTSPNPST